MRENPFMAAVLKLMRAERMPIRNVDEAIEAARRQFPELYEDYIATFFDDSLSVGDDTDTGLDSSPPEFFKASALGAGLELSMPPKLSASKDEGPRRFRMTGYTGQVLRLTSESLVINVPGITAASRLPVLREHARDRVVGYGKAWNDGKNFYVDGAFSTVTPDAREVLALFEEGYPWQVSVGIWPLEKRSIQMGASQTINGRPVAGPATVWSRSRVGEVSFVSLGMDSNTSVGRA